VGGAFSQCAELRLTCCKTGETRFAIESGGPVPIRILYMYKGLVCIGTSTVHLSNPRQQIY
jgi:hypothetical protein